MSQETPKKKGFPGQFWLVVMFEFFERGAYYGMMSFISVYFVNVLHFPKENVGVIKGVIQPLLYFLPILSGALADRFGYRRILMIAFTLLGGGYFLTSQASEYGAVFAALVIMGVGAGLFKPIISGTIARVTDESNSTLGFGIFYWTINLGAFLFPLILVPFLKGLNPRYVIIASAICTAVMILPTLLFYKEPTHEEDNKDKKKTNLIQTLANAFEIIYSPVVLIYYQMKKSAAVKIVLGIVLAVLLVLSVGKFMEQPPVEKTFSKVGVVTPRSVLVFDVNRNMLGKTDYTLTDVNGDSTWLNLTLYKPSLLDTYQNDLFAQLKAYPGFEQTTAADLEKWLQQSDEKIVVTFVQGQDESPVFKISKGEGNRFTVTLNDKEGYSEYSGILLQQLQIYPVLAGLTVEDLNGIYDSMGSRAFFPLFVVALIIIGLTISAISVNGGEKKEAKSGINLPFILVLLIGAGIWILPGMALLGKIIASVIYVTVTSLFITDKSDPAKFADHAKFLLMIFLYSGFWVLYFQMFDSVLWYVQAYVDATSLNNAVNGFLGLFGLESNWFFDVEHVTVINAGTIILLQLIISAIVRKTKALPTMMFGIALGTIGMAILAINTSIWVFMAGITIFSIGEMTAHPKFISYIGLVAPKDKKAMYMGYLFLYGVFGSSIGGIVGARLYVQFVDNMNQPRTLWLIFSCIGVFTIVALALYNKFMKPQEA